MLYLAVHVHQNTSFNTTGFSFPLKKHMVNSTGKYFGKMETVSLSPNFLGETNEKEKKLNDLPSQTLICDFPNESIMCSLETSPKIQNLIWQKGIKTDVMRGKLSFK